jgi:hypothetical protein
MTRRFVQIKNGKEGKKTRRRKEGTKEEKKKGRKEGRKEGRIGERRQQWKRILR